MEQFLYVLRPVRPEMLTQGPTAEEIAVVSRHFAYLEDLTRKGTMILVGRTTEDNEDTIGLAVFEAESESAARQIMARDPAVLEGVMSAHLHPFRIALQRQS
jgi:uncharacterized protein YciI